MEAENAKETRLLNLNLRKCEQRYEQLVVPLMILDIRPFASGITNCLLMLTNKNYPLLKGEKTVTKSWMSTEEMKDLFAITDNKSLVDDYEKTIRRSLENCSQKGLQHKQIRLDTQLLPRQFLNKLTYDRLAWVESLRIQLGIADKRRAAYKLSFSPATKQTKKFDSGMNRNPSLPMDGKESGLLDEDSTFDSQSLFLVEGKAVQSLPTSGHNNDAKNTQWITLRFKLEQLKRQRNLERKARHTARWELKDPKVYDCKVDRRNRAKTRKSSKTRKLLKKQISNKVSLLKSLKIRFARTKLEIVSNLSSHLESCRNPTKGLNQLIKTKAVSDIVSEFVDSLATDR